MIFDKDGGNKSERFNSCDNIAAYYEQLDVPLRKTVGYFGGKSYTWYVSSEKGQNYQVRCFCSLMTFGFGMLKVESRMASNDINFRWFKGKPDVGTKSGSFHAESPFGYKVHEFRLPKPS